MNWFSWVILTIIGIVSHYVSFSSIIIYTTLYTKIYTQQLSRELSKKITFLVSNNE